MRFIDYITLAFRNIWHQKLRSALTVFAVVIGALSVTIMLALVFSAKGFMTEQFEQSGILQQVIVSPQTDITWQDQGGGSSDQCPTCVKLDEALITKIDNFPHVTGISRVVHTNVFQGLEFDGKKFRVQNVESHDINGVQKSSIIAGREFTPNDDKGLIIVSSDYADKLGFKNNYQGLIGKTVQLLTQNYYSGEGSDPVKRQEEMQAFFKSHPGVDGRDFQPSQVVLKAKIIGITDTQDNSYTMRVPLAWARGLKENIQYQPAQQNCSHDQPCTTTPAKVTTTDELAKNGYDSLVIKADQSSNATLVANEIKRLGVGATDAQSFISQQLAIFNIIGAVLGGIGGIALAVAAVGVVNTMVMAILERTREIGVMRAIGARRSTISRLFTFEASLLGFLGGIIGLLIGYGLTLIANPIINKQLSSNSLVITDIVHLPVWLIVGVIVITTFIGMLAGLYPARRAAHLDPVEALHYE